MSQFRTLSDDIKVTHFLGTVKLSIQNVSVQLDIFVVELRLDT